MHMARSRTIKALNDAHYHGGRGESVTAALPWGWLLHHVISIGGAGAALLVGGLSLLAPLLAPADPTAIDLTRSLLPPSSVAWLGTDHLGRDLLSRVLWAGRTSLIMSAVVLGISLALGLLVGLVAGYTGGLIDQCAMRVVDSFLALPTIVLTLALIGTFGTGLPVLVSALTIGWWAPYARLVRSQVLTVRHSPYLEAAVAIGAGHGHIMRVHLLPGILGPLLVQVSLDVGAVLLAIGALSFLGLGVQPPDPEWGTMIIEARPFLDYAPHVILAPGMALFLTVLGWNALGELLAQRLRAGRL
jgi:peptide/nickel transport system permease protein